MFRDMESEDPGSSDLSALPEAPSLEPGRARVPPHVSEAGGQQAGSLCGTSGRELSRQHRFKPPQQLPSKMAHPSCSAGELYEACSSKDTRERPSLGSSQARTGVSCSVLWLHPLCRPDPCGDLEDTFMCIVCALLTPP